jgi:fructokinase
MLHSSNICGCVGTGFIVLDLIRDAVAPKTTERRFAGGSCGNVLAILAYFGWHAHAVGRIGDDPAGLELIADLENWGVQTSLLRVESGRGTPVIVQENYLDAKGRARHRFLRNCPVCGAALPTYRPLIASEAAKIAEALPAHSVFYFDRVAPGTLKLAYMARANGALVVFEPSGIKDARLFTECLKVAHVLKYASDRIKGIDDVVAKAKVPLEIKTLGAKGLRLRIRTGARPLVIEELPAFTVPDLRDAAGSGDWTTAGLIHGLVNTEGRLQELVTDPEAVVLATRRGQALATLNCGFEGARGLMYASDAGRVLKLSSAIVGGTQEPNLTEAQLSECVRSELGNETACINCSGSN